jgi:hypothetical protein
MLVAVLSRLPRTLLTSMLFGVNAQFFSGPIAGEEQRGERIRRPPGLATGAS